MKVVIAIVVFLVFLFFAVYSALWVCFIGGIVDFIEAAKANPIDAWGIAWALLKFFVIQPICWLFVYLGIILSGIIIVK